MWIVSLLITLGASPCLLVSVFRWSGRWQSSLQDRKRGWPFFRTLAAWVPLQGLGLIGLAIEADDAGWDASNLLWFISVSMIVLAPWPLLVFGYLWAPRFLLPGWVRERLRHRDPVQTEDPPPEIQERLRHRRNQPPSEQELLEKQIRKKHQVDVGGWVIGAAATSVTALVLLSAALGIGPAGLEVGQNAPIRPGAVTQVTSGNIWSFRIRYGAVGLMSLALAVFYVPRVPRQVRRAREAHAAEVEERAARGLPPR